MRTHPFGSTSCLIVLSLVLVTACYAGETPEDVPIQLSPAAIPSIAINVLPTAETLSATPSSANPSPVPTPVPDTGWQQIRPGMERRIINLFDGAGRIRETVYLLRLQPDHFVFSIGYQAGNPQSLANWRQQTGALVVVNGGFFTPDFAATGLTIVDGQASGRSYQSYGGMFAVGPSGPTLRSLVSRPYDPDEPLQYALQSFPLLIKPGGHEGYEDDDGLAARRTVIAQDRDGRFLFLVTQWGSFTLHELSGYLLNSDLDLHIALNLDGGASSGILLHEPQEGIPSYALLPVVILVLPR